MRQPKGGILVMTLVVASLALLGLAAPVIS